MICTLTSPCLQSASGFQKKASVQSQRWWHIGSHSWCHLLFRSPWSHTAQWTSSIPSYERDQQGRKEAFMLLNHSALKIKFSEHYIPLLKYFIMHSFNSNSQVVPSGTCWDILSNENSFVIKSTSKPWANQCTFLKQNETKKEPQVCDFGHQM